MEYKYIDLDRLNTNCSGDDSMKKELLNMGIDTICMSSQKIKELLVSQDWHILARTLHQLRPVLSYCGVINYLSDIEKIEKDIIHNNYCDPDGFIKDLQSNLDRTITEINSILGEL
jgi:HPt (histidine-containing phosphotransfer) domain-containing protein